MTNNKNKYALTVRQKDLWIRFENNLLNEGLSQKRINKLELMFKTLERGLYKDFDKVGRPEIEEFINKLNRNEFKTTDNRDFSGNSKSDIKKFIKQFWKWFRGENEFYPKDVSWIKTRIRKDELPEEKTIISPDEAIMLANSFNKVEYKTAVLLLFDSGFRIQELLSVKRKDITWEEYDEGQKCFWINCNESKTEKRKIPVPLFTEELQAFYNSTEFQQLQEDDLVFKFSYTVFFNWLKSKSKQVLGKKISPHCLRHSSATYYARAYNGDMKLMADKYGWSYNSDQLNTYIRKSGEYQKQGAKKVFTNEVLRVKEQLTQMSEENKKIREELEYFHKNINEIIKQKIEDNRVSKEIIGMMPQS